MSTTSLFVELLVIGSGVFVWLILLLFAAYGVDVLPLTQTVVLVSAVPVLSLIYVLGIVWDRVADALFSRLWADGLRHSQFNDIGEYYNARRLILTQSSQLSELLEYGRSRLRICRGWTLNAPLIGISLNLLLFSEAERVDSVASASVAATILSVVLMSGSWFAWNSLAKAEYRKIREQADFLRENAGGN